MPAITSTARQTVNGEPSWVCPICGNGQGDTGDGLTRNPKSRDGNGLKCFKCGFSGDVIDLYRAYTGADDSAALAALANAAGIDPGAAAAPRAAQEATGGPQREAGGAGAPSIPPEGKDQQRANNGPTERQADFSAYFALCRKRLEDPAAAAYLARRGISMETARKAGCGFDPQADPASCPGEMGTGPRKHAAPRIIFPSGNGPFFTGRRIDGGEAVKYANAGGQRIDLFGQAALYAQDAQEALFIVEGPFDALAIMECGGCACALNGVANAEELLERLREKRPTAPALVLALDNDEAGQAAAAKLREGLTRLRIPFAEADRKHYGGQKDPAEALQLGGVEAFGKAVAYLKQAAAKAAEELRAAIQREELERRRITGAGMMDAFERAISSRRYEPVPTGIKGLDYILGGGLFRGWLVLLGAAPGTGKTNLAQWLLENMARRGTSVVYLNLEMTIDQLLARSISRIAAAHGEHITATQVLQGYKWDSDQREAIREALEEYRREISPQLIYNPEEVGPGLDSIMKYLEAEAQRAEAACLPAPLVCLDYLQIVGGREREDETALLKRAVASLKDYARRHNTCVICIIAHNRQSNSSGDATMESARDTSALEYSADCQLAITFTACTEDENGERLKKPKKPAELTPEERRLLTLRLLKSRFTAPGREIRLDFDGETSSFRELAAGRPTGISSPGNSDQARAERLKKAKRL